MYNAISFYHRALVVDYTPKQGTDTGLVFPNGDKIFRWNDKEPVGFVHFVEQEEETGGEGVPFC